MSERRKIALVTGGSRGLGRSMVLNLAKRGVDSIATYNSDQTQAESVANLVREAGCRSVILHLDVGKSDTFDTFVESVGRTLKSLGADRFDYLVNNAGIAHHQSLEATTEAELDVLYNIHVKGVFFLTQKLLPLLNDGGRIVNISSGLTRFTMPTSGAYASMKGAVEVLTRYMALEFSSRKISVNVVAPGAIANAFGGGAIRDNPEINKTLADRTALGRVGVPEDIGPMVASLLADENHWITGQRIEVSGGMFL